MGLAAMGRRRLEREPAHVDELVPVELDRDRPVAGDNIPERHIGVAGCETDGVGDGHHRGRRHGRDRDHDSEFLTQFPDHRRPRMLVDLHVATGRQPQLRIPVIDKKDVSLVDDSEVDNEVFRWRGRLRDAEDGRPGVEPGQRVVAVRRFDGIQRIDLKELRTNTVVHVSFSAEGGDVTPRSVDASIQRVQPRTFASRCLILSSRWPLRNQRIGLEYVLPGRHANTLHT